MSVFYEIIEKSQRLSQENNSILDNTILLEINDFFESVKSAPKERKLLIRKFINCLNITSTLNEVICCQIDVLLNVMKLFVTLSEVEEFWVYFRLLWKTYVGSLSILEQTKDVCLYETEFVEILIMTDVVFRRFFKSDIFSNQKENYLATYKSIFQFSDKILYNQTLTNISKFGIFFLHKNLLKMFTLKITKLKHSEKYLYKFYDIGYVLLEVTIKLWTEQFSSFWFLKLLEEFVLIFDILCTFGDNLLKHHQESLQMLFRKSLKIVFNKWNQLPDCEITYGMLFAVVNYFLWSSNYKMSFKTKIIEYIRKYIFADDFFIMSERYKSQVLHDQIKFLLIGLNVFDEYDIEENFALEILKKLFCCNLNSLLSLFSLHSSNQIIRDHFENNFYILGAGLKQNQPKYSEIILHNLCDLIKNIDNGTILLSRNMFWKALNMFLKILSRVNSKKFSETIFHSSKLFNKKLQEELKNDDSLTNSIINKRILLWLKDYDDDNRMFYKMIPLYLRQKSKTINQKICKIINVNNIIYLLLSNDMNQVKNGSMILNAKKLSEDHIAFLLEKLLNDINLQQENVLAILNVCLKQKDLITTENRNLIFRYILKTILKQESIVDNFYCKYFYLYLFDFVVKFAV